MKKPILALAASALALCAASPALSQTPAWKLTPERVFAEPSLSGPTVKGLALSPDGQLVTYIKSRDDDRLIQDLWAADTKGGAPFRLIDGKALSSGKALTEAEMSRRERARVADQGGVIEYRWDSEGRFVLAPVDGDLFLASRADKSIRRLTSTPGDEVDAKVSPKGRYVSYVREQNLYVMDVASGAERALTTDGKDTLTWGAAEFIAEEELDRHTGYWWSPGEDRIALARVDESGVDVVPRADIGANGATVVNQRYPKAGRPNAAVELYVQPLAGGERVKIDLGADPDIYLARVNWAKDGKTLYVQRLSRDNKRLDLLAADPATGASKIIASQTSDTWVDLNDDFRPLKDGRFIWSSEQSGFRHLYLHAADGQVIRPLTAGDWPVEALRGVDEARGVVLFTASLDTPLEMQLYSVGLKAASQPKALTAGHGWWSVSVANKGGVFTGQYSDPLTPPQVALYDAAGKRLRWLEENRLDAAHPYGPFKAGLTAPEYGTIKAASGEDLHYAITKPADFDASKKYPVIVLPYGGPGSQTVKRSWQAVTDRLYLDRGYVVLRLDNRGSPNRSVAFKHALYHRLGGVEVADQIAGVKFLKTLPFVDPARIGVSGWSYGGFMVMSLLTEPGSGFAAGASGAPPTDWALYDTAYTERYMGKPGENPDGYKASDIVPRLPRLSGDLLLLHGMADDNVIFENSTRIMAAMQQAGQRFETMLYPGQRHRIGGTGRQLQLWRTYLDFFDRTLKGGR